MPRLRGTLPTARHRNRNHRHRDRLRRPRRRPESRELRPLLRQADGCLAELKELGVFVNDRLKGWRADGGIFPTHERTEGDGDATPAGAGVDEAAVLALIARRAEAKKDKDYDQADELVETLLDEHAVVLDDKRGTWRVVRLTSGFYRVGPRPDAATAAAVEEALAGIAAAVEDKTEYVAEELLERLEREHGVSVDEELRTWRVARVDRRGRRYR